MEALTAWWESLGPWSAAFEVLFIIIGSFLAWCVLQFVIRRVVHSVVYGVKRKQGVDDTQALNASPLAAVRVVQRTRTLGGVLSSVVTTIIVIIAAILVMTTLAPDAAGAFSLITAAIGAGLGFGAQNIVKDVLNGLFMVIEDQLGVGDVVDLGPATGVVEAVGIRITDIRDVNGTLWHVRNGEILRVGNLSQGWARAIIDLAVPYDVDTDEAQKIILDTAVALASESKWRRVIMERPEVWGIESISADAIVIRLVVKTRTSAKDEVARELRARLKRALDAEGIRLPSLNSVVLSGYEGAGSILGHRPPNTTPLPVQPTGRRPRIMRAPKTPKNPPAGGTT
ncbi:mechanosensitive ion channel family protein [Salinibacterium sp. ZJ70]|uniref:mechanosensitive ion channel family protein n=1 Tax=Salinibacterium sp. ZJ70 TaxID=2708084 RepID=UPI00141D995E|nr:mechanosensitive ion channel domain-containing protein [Salinibacterium sp. ZJ70]